MYLGLGTSFRIACALAAAAPWLIAQSGPQYLAVYSAVDNAPQPYALYLPKGFDPSHRYPLIVSLHSEDSDHRLNLSQLLSGPPRNLFGIPSGYTPPVTFRDIDFIVACPLARGALGYQGIAEQDVYDVLADVERRYPIDEDRVYLTGISMGGAGALWLAMTRPDVWAAVAPLCPDALPGEAELAPNLLNVPVRLFQGEVDPIIPASSTRAWQKRLLDLNIPAAYYEYQAVRHNVWEIAYRPGAAFDWFSPIRRDRYPTHVRFLTRSYQHRAAYWITIDGLTPGLLASIDAERNGSEIRVTTSNVDGFTISLPAADMQPRRVIVNDTPIVVKPAASLSFTRAPAGWRPGVYQLPAKRPGSEGPIVAAVSSRHIYVYGTLATTSADEIAARRKVAEQAAGWSTIRSRLALKLPVKADTEVTADDMDSSDLVLFGNAQSNAVIARIAADLPLALRPDAADYGLLLIAPVGRHYALISSGLPWWTGSDVPTVAGYPLAPAQFRILAGLGDFLLFRGSVDQVVAGGRFDTNWKVPADAAAKIAATGTCTIR